MNFDNIVKNFMPKLQRLNSAEVAAIPHPPQVIMTEYESIMNPSHQVLGAIITGGTSADAKTIARYRFDGTSIEYLENYYIKYFSSQGWKMDSQRVEEVNGDFSYKFHRHTTCASLRFQPSDNKISLAVWHDFWQEIPFFYNLFGITKFVVGWQYILPRCPIANT